MGPDGFPVHICVVEVEYTVVIPVHLRSKIGIGRRRMGVTGDPDQDLRIVCQQLMYGLVWLGKEAWGIGVSVVAR